MGQEMSRKPTWGGKRAGAAAPCDRRAMRVWKAHAGARCQPAPQVPPPVPKDAIGLGLEHPSDVLGQRGEGNLRDLRRGGFALDALGI